MESIENIIQQANILEQELPPSPPMPSIPQGRQVSAWIDHTLLKPEATSVQIRALCEEARNYQFAAVCVNPVFVPLAAKQLAGSGVAVCTVVGFPLGATLATHKAFETLGCIHAGAVEIDMVLSIGALKSGDYQTVIGDIQAVVQIAHAQQAMVKVILETAFLTRREKIMACLLCKEAGADFVKTSTGFAGGGATTEDVNLMRRVVGTGMGVKAAGGIRTLEDALAMIRAGASRIGASSGVQIMQESLA